MILLHRYGMRWLSVKIQKYCAIALFYILIIGIFISTTFLISETTSTIAQMIPVERSCTIIIDAGHGGVDGGATSCTGVLESQFNLEIAMRLNDLFHLLGYETIMVRTSDISVYTEGGTIATKKVSDLKNRVALVNKTNNAILVSIHQNTFSDSQYSGAQVFYGTKGESRELADLLQASFSQTLNPGSKRATKKADGIYLMEHINCTGVLIECGFLSNPEEEAKLRSTEYQLQLCSVIAATMSNYLDQ